MAKLKCPSCKSSNVQLLESHTNEKTKKSTSLNLNPLKPFTVFNHKEKKKKEGVWWQNSFRNGNWWRVFIGNWS